ncbi:sensor histidine kinase [Salmonirosea aquatica]|uniref:histidine kinase n=1 Tax=Salmonirosea aquatica TaxID=2654236 RepID=A0A7C9F9W2_9BACT|nr:hypothetical protein [Cytophagaceae bacterium SJW1-29]
MRKWIILWALVLGFSVVKSQPIVWDGTKESVGIGRQVSYYEDPEGVLTIDQVSSDSLASRFTRSTKDILNFGFSESVHWVRFNVDNRTQETLLLEVAQPYLPVADLYYREPSGKWHVQKSGYQVNLYKKRVKHFYQIFTLPTYPTPVYLRYVSYSQPVPLSIWKEQAFEVKSNKQIIVYGMYFGVLLFVIINNLFLFLSLRRSIYLHYVFVVVFYILDVACVMEGFILYLYPEIDLLYWFLLVPNISTAVTFWFGIRFLEVKKYTPRLYRFSLVILAYCVSYIVWSMYLPLMVEVPLNSIHSLFNLGFILYLGIQTGRKGNRSGYYYAFSYTFFVLLIFVEAFYIQVGSPTYLFELTHVSIGIFLEVLFLAYLLSRRFEWERQDIEKAKTDAQQMLLEKTRENERILLVQNETLEREVAERTKAIEHKSVQLQQSLDHLKNTQAQLVQNEKLASLGELTAGIAHEIQNPLNFVNNYSEVNLELFGELTEELEKENLSEARAIINDLTENEQKINHHGRRADAIVKGMLDHARTVPGDKTLTNLNALADEFLRLAYQSIRAKNSDFQCELHTEFDPELGKINMVSSEIGRVLLNLYSNALYSLAQRQQMSDPDYTPALWVSSSRGTGESASIRIRDNGTGMAEEVRAKIFQPFFTTKPPGEGTGLGLSLSYDIITKGHGGTIEVKSTEGVGTTFVIVLPLAE